MFAKFELCHEKTCVLVIAWTEQIKCRGLSEQPNHMRMATKSYNIKLAIEIILINVNHSSPALERSFLNNWGLKSILQAPNLTLIFCRGSQHLVSCSVLGNYCNVQPSQATENPVGGKACSSTKGCLLRYIPNTYSNHKVSSF